MGVKSIKPTSPGNRFSTRPDFAEITKSTPEKSLTAALRKSGGRNNKGRITVRHRGGGHRRRYRIIDSNEINMIFQQKLHQLSMIQIALPTSLYCNTSMVKNDIS